MQLDKSSAGSAKDIEKTTKGIPQQGRPIGAKDSQQRTRTTKADFDSDNIAQLITLTTWSKSAMYSISEIINKAMLQVYNIKSAREFTTEQSKDIEYLKFTSLAYIKPYDVINEQQIFNIMSSKNELPKEYRELYKEFYDDFIKSRNREPNMEENRTIYASVYAWLNI
jgi:hypothetical protein